MTNEPDRYAVIGNPVAHSRSPEIHAAFARQTGQTLVYDRLHAERHAFDESVGRFFEAGGRGLNVTLPFKTQAAAFADELTERARRAGAVNTLAARADGRILGDNTDGTGLVRDLVDRLGVGLRGARILILGAGGAVRGVVPVLLHEQPTAVRVVNRSADKARGLAREFADLGPIEGAGLDAPGRGWDLLINAISAGLEDAMPDLDPAIAVDAGAAYDMIYADHATPFLRWAGRAGIDCRSDGFGMLVEQAAESFALWRGVRPHTRALIAALRPSDETV